MTAIKICGVTRVEDATVCARAGADFVGLNFWPSSKRRLTIEEALPVSRASRTRGAMIVGVFVDAALDDIARIAEAVRLDIVQLHGDESPAFCAQVKERTGLRVWKAIAVAAAADVDRLERWPTHAVLLDAATPGRGGSGQTIDWTVARRAAETDTKIVLAGGLTPENVGAAVGAVKPWAVDVASGVESAPGIKDASRILQFIRAVREVPPS